MTQLFPRTDTELDDLYRNAPKSGDAAQCIKFLQRAIHPTALSEAAFFALGEADNPPYTETMMLVVAMANHLNWPLAWANAALQVEWHSCKAAASSAIEAAEKAARRLIFQRAPGERVLHAALEPIERAGINLPTDSVVAMCRRIAQGGNVGAPRVRAR